MLILLFTIILLSAIVGVFLSALFINDKYKLKYSMIFVAVGCVSLLTAFGDNFFIGIVISCAMTAMVLTVRKKYVLWLSWIATAIFTMPILINLILYVSNNGDSPSYYFFEFLLLITAYVLVIALLITATVLWAVRNKKEQLKSIATEQLNAEGYYARRVSKNGFAIAGNVLSCISYVATLMGVRAALKAMISVWVPAFAVAVALGIIAWFLLRHAVTYGYCGTPCATALYIWSWVPTVVVVAILVIAALIMCVATGVSFTETVNKKVYKIIDENGEVRTISYDGTQTYAKCVDDKGEWWETFDGGSTFRKCGEFKIKHDDGTETRLRDVSGANSLLEDDLGGLYESEDGGKTVHKVE